MSDVGARESIPAEENPTTSTRNDPSASTQTDSGRAAESGTTEEPSKKRSLLPIPSRSSSHVKQDQSATSTALTGATANEDGTSIGKNSNNSVGRQQRDTSRASSRRRRRGPTTPGDVANAGSAKEDVQTTPKQPQKKNLFLSFLNCCSGPDGKMDTEGPNVPAKRTTRSQTAGAPSSSEKPTSSRSDQKTSEANALDEKMQTNGSAGQPQSSNEKELPKDPRNDTSQQALDSAVGAGIAIPAIAGPSHDVEEAETSPTAVPVVSQPANNSTTQPVTDSSQLPTPPADQEAPPIADRTEKQIKRDSDIDMLDAPPVEEKLQQTPPVAEEKVTSGVALPPPPPIVNKEQPVASTEVPPVPGPPAEGQKWLLPPVQPHLKGRKCLVLDLDETLVHASFKVRSWTPQMIGSC